MCLGAVTAARAETAPVDSLSVGEIQIRQRSIFSAEEEQSGTLLVGTVRRLMNRLHFNTRKWVIRRELLFRTGEPLRPNLLAETERNLRTLGFLNDIRVQPTDTLAGGRVPVEVSLRESWSLRTDFSYTQASGGDSRWNVQMSDNNFLGYGVTMGAGVGGDEDAGFWNLWYRQRRFLGTELYFGMDDRERDDGYIREIFIHRPFWAEGDRWGLETRYWDHSLNERYYLSNGGPAGVDPERPSSLYALLSRREKGAEISVLLRAGRSDEGRIWRPGLGARWTETRLDPGAGSRVLSDGCVMDLAWLAGPDQPLGRDDGTTVWPYFRLHTRGRGWTKERFILHYGAVEDINLTPVADVKVGPVLAALGTDTASGEDRWRAEGIWEQWVVSGPGVILLHGSAEAEWGAAAADYHRYSLLAGWMGHWGAEDTPWLTRAFAEYGHGQALVGSRAFTLGLDQGLRTLEFDGMAGDRLLRWTLEEGKVLPGEMLGMFRYGLGAFFASGAAWWQDEDRDSGDARHEVGFGLRFGPTRSANAATGRIDVVWDLDHGDGPVLTATTQGFF
ncbi:hypothetical protein CO151_03160 [bacterium CG_4_9_14_3_um_filter_65_15]|nr:MAG: hypothetical protein CO151_03160 [bacterium CG_4_9_14_3_um_filter_65_15]